MQSVRELCEKVSCKVCPDAVLHEPPGDPGALAGGISEALITTAAGLTVAIPSLIGYRYFRSRVDALVVQMEKEALKLVEAVQRRRDLGTSAR